MKGMVLGSIITVVLFTGSFVSQVEAKNDNNNDHGKLVSQKIDKHDLKDLLKDLLRFFKNVDKHDGNGKSVPIPGTLLLLGGGFAGLVAWRARQRKPRA